MERPLNPAPDELAALGPRTGRWGRLVLLGLVAWQGWMTLTLFGPGPACRGLLDNRPIVSGRHPLHLYHGYLGARSLRERGTVCCYDPAFQAGYPKTPVFDSGSRPAELFLSLAGGGCWPAAYKLGLAACCLAVPVWLWVAARGAGLDPGPSSLAAALGLLVWWSVPGRQLLEAGDLDLLLAGLAAVAAVGLLLHFHRRPGAGSWGGLFLSCCLGWFAQPLLFASLLPLTLLYYLTVGARHRLGWHAALLAAVAGGVAVNAFWLVDGLSYWWIRSPLPLEVPLLPHRTLRLLWAAPLWGEAPDRVLAAGLLTAAALGVGIFNETGQRAAARLFGLGSGGFLLLAVAGLVWEPLGRIGTVRLLVPALWFAAIPAVYAAAEGLRLASRVLGGRGRVAVLAALLLSLVGFACPGPLGALLGRAAGTTPLAIGLPREARAWVNVLRASTTPEARILWEDLSGPAAASQWSALLPLLTERAFLGGLDPEACIEHAYAGFVDQNLAGRPLADWTTEELSAFCRRYNVGWVVCRSPAAAARFRAWPAAVPVRTASDGGPGCLFRLPPPSFALKGQARLLHADGMQIALADLVPADGQVVLSLHYQAGLHASPSHGVQIEREPDAHDPIPFIRLRLPGPIARLTLTWSGR